MNRFDRITAILLQLQARRMVSGPSLAERFGVSLRTIYRDLRTLEQAGVPLLGEPGKGYSLAEGYRLPPVMFTREEAAALLAAEKLAARLTDAGTARLSGAAMDKLRAVLRHADRDYLETLTPHIQVLGRDGATQPPNAYQLLGTAIATHRSVWLTYHKQQSPATGIAYTEAVEEALCYGWIDGRVQPVDAHTYRQYFSRRKPLGTWSRINKERVARLLAAGQLAPAGLAAIETARQNGAWVVLDEVEALAMPPDLEAV